MEDIEKNKTDGIIYIKVDGENRVSHTSEITKDTSSGEWIKIDWDYSELLCNIGDYQGLYDPITNNVTLINWLEFKSNRDKISKEQRIIDVSNIIVATSTGKVFDGDEASQDRMVRAINIATITGATATKWKMADNSIVEVTLDELKEALALSGLEMSKIWLEQ